MLKRYCGPLSALILLTLLVACSGNTEEIVRGEKAHIVYYEMPG